MEQLALSHEILMQVEKPARYIGNEINMVKKDPDKVAIRFAMCFPDVYEIGMSHLGIQILYEMFNRREDTWCERVYSPWPDLHKILKEQKIPLFALESQQPISNFDFLGITIQYEMCYTNIIQILDLAQIGIFARDRAEDAPIVIGGGPCTYNPEPLADFFDLFYIGEGETKYDELLDLYRENRRRGGSRQDFLRLAAGVEGIYVPSLYTVSYLPDGRIESMQPSVPEAPQKVRKQVAMDLTHTVYPLKPLVAFLRPTQERVTLEIQRGCIRGCRFCQAGMIYRPLRERNVEQLKEWALTMLRETGHEEITLSSLSSSDYSALEELTYFLIDECKEKYINISLPSLRIDAFSLDVMQRVQDIKKSSLTFAPEAGTQRMRDVINKGLTQETILNGAMQAFHGGWNKVKLYFMLGLPFETDEDVKGIPQLADTIANAYYTIPKEQRNGRVSINASASFFVPKPFTPFQWAPMDRQEEFVRKAHLANDTMRAMHNHRSLSFQYHDAPTTVLEGILARGDRRLGKTLYHIYEKGAIFDAWTEFFQPQLWWESFQEDGVDVDFYTTRERDLDEVFPWDFIDVGVTKEFLKREYLRAAQAQTTPNCKVQCQGCGAMAWKGGICVAGKN